MKNYLFSLLSDDNYTLLFCSLGVLFVAVVVSLIFYFTHNAKKIRFVLYGCVLYALLLAIFCFVVDIMKHYNTEYAEKNWLDLKATVSLLLVPLLIVFSLTFVYFVLGIIFSKRTFFKTFLKIGGVVICLALLYSLICLGRYYALKIKNDGYYNSDTASVKQIALYLSTVLLIGGIVLLAVFSKDDGNFDTRSVAYAGITVALSFALSYIKLFSMPQGGSLTLVSLLPVTVYAYIFGVKKGCIVGAVYGILQAVQSPWLIHPAQFLLDYPVAFSAVGLTGLFRKKMNARLGYGVGVVITGVVRFVSHVLSGVFAFSAYADGKNVFTYSLAYNSFVLIDILLVCVAGIILFSNTAFRKAVLKN